MCADGKADTHFGILYHARLARAFAQLVQGSYAEGCAGVQVALAER